MSFKAQVIIDNKIINVLWYTFEFNRYADASGKPTSAGIFRGLTIAIETRKTINFAEWAFSSTERKNIELHIFPIILGGRTRVIKLYDCYLLNWDNIFSSTNRQPMHEILHISAGGFKDTNSYVEYSAPWRKSFDHDDVKPTVLEDDDEGIVKEFYFEDANRNKISKIRKNKEVYLVIKTDNMEGKSIDIDLSDDEYNFEYQGKILPDDQLLNFAITSSTMRISLKTIKQE